MKPINNALWLSLVVIIGVSCATSQSRFSLLGRSYPPKPETFDVEVFQTGAPSRPFARVSRLDVHLEKTGFVSSSLSEALPDLKKQARLSGADAVVELRESRWSVNETQVYHVTATGIRYTDSQ